MAAGDRLRHCAFLLVPFLETDLGHSKCTEELRLKDGMIEMINGTATETRARSLG